MSAPLARLADNLRYLQECGKLQERDIPDAIELLSVEELCLLAARLSLRPEQLLTQRLRPQPQPYKMLVMDCDGVLTDGSMIVHQNGGATKHFNVKDGQGIVQAHARGLLTGIISAGHSTGVVEKRAAQLGIARVYVGRRPKWEVLQEWLQAEKLSPQAVAYIGDDLNDIPVLEKVGGAFCPADAVASVRHHPQVHVLQSEGGKGCVREWIDTYLL